MKVENTNTFIKEGNIDDIRIELFKFYENAYPDCYEFSKQFRSDSIKETCKKIYDYLLENITYVEDPAGFQYLKTPARFLYDGIGDCKNFSIFTACILRCLDIPFVFRFVGYKNDIISHVYIVAFDNIEEIIIDCVATIQKNVKFNKEIDYNIKIDMEGKTKICSLKGMDNEKLGIVSGGNIAENFLKVKIAFEENGGNDYEAEIFKGFLEKVQSGATAQELTEYENEVAKILSTENAADFDSITLTENEKSKLISSNIPFLDYVNKEIISQNHVPEKYEFEENLEEKLQELAPKLYSVISEAPADEQARLEEVLEEFSKYLGLTTETVKNYIVLYGKSAKVGDASKVEAGFNYAEKVIDLIGNLFGFGKNKNTELNQNANYPQYPQYNVVKQNNTPLYIIGGIAVAAIAYFLFKGKNKENKKKR